MRQETKDAQDLRRSTWLQKGTALKPTSDDSGMVSGSLTPSWSCRGSPTHLHGNTVEPEEKQQEEDEFMPTTQEVARWLAGMRSGDDTRDGGHKVSCEQFEDHSCCLSSTVDRKHHPSKQNPQKEHQSR